MLLAFTLSPDSIILAIVAIVAAFIAARYTEKYRNQSENEAEHYKQIKVNVLNPMLKQIDQYYLPILEFKRENLFYDRRDTKKFAVGLSEQPTTYEVVGSIVPANISSSRILQEDEQSHIENGLFEDCRKKHFKTLFEEWERLTSKVNEFNRESLELANLITESIAKMLSLPVINDWDRSGQYVTPYCGVAIFNRMAGTGIYQLIIGVENMGYGTYLIVKFGNSIIQLDPSTDVQKVRSIIDNEINERREKFLYLKTKAESINKEFVPFRTQLATQLEKQKLPGKCDYV
ncbi:hypothetical protein MUP77_17120 [Candidatus Bathyarchaeota archaeon]|nr:hypothetical protein [Candidatus Bathyarchaeota archaeon]